jgi:hypothetical protein
MSGYESQKRQGLNIGSVLRNLSLMATGGTMLLALVTVVGVWRSGERFFDGVRAMFTAPQPPPQVDVRSVVVQQVRGVSELTTAIFAMEAVVPASRDRTLGGYTIGKTTLLYIAYGEVRAGVDLAKLDESDIQLTANTLRLQLPPPEILDSKIDVTRSNVYDYDRGFLSLGPDAAPELQQLAQQETLKKVVAAACAQGILQEANDRAELAVSQLLTTAGYANFSVETQVAAEDNCAIPTP